jgi:hypothetical protein
MLSYYPNFEMKPEQVLTGVVAQGASQQKACPPGRKIVYINQTNTPTATVKVQGSVDGTNWDDLYTHTTAGTAGSKTVELDDLYPKHRVNVSAYTAGTVDAWIAVPVAR